MGVLCLWTGRHREIDGAHLTGGGVQLGIGQSAYLLLSNGEARVSSPAQVQHLVQLFHVILTRISATLLFYRGHLG